MKPRIGVYTCHCGLNIANTVDVGAVSAFARGLPNVLSARDYTYMCSDPGQALITEDIRELSLTHVVVASCSPRMHEPTFRAAIGKAGLNPYCLEMANIREQCSWVHADRAGATLKAMDLVASAVGKVAWLVPLQEREVGVTEAALVIGGGIAGIHAALDVADANFKVYLVEREGYLGGRAAQLDKTFPTLERVSDLIAPLIDRVTAHPNIRLFTNADVKQVDGFIGNFHVKVDERPILVDPDKCTACGKCAEACPVSVADRFNANLTTHRAIYQLPLHSAPPMPKENPFLPAASPVPFEDLGLAKGGNWGVSPYAIDERACAFVQDHVCTPPLLPLVSEGPSPSLSTLLGAADLPLAKGNPSLPPSSPVPFEDLRLQKGG